MKHILKSEFADWEKRYRGHFMNSISGFKPVSLVGTWHLNGCANLAVFSNIFHLGADPAMIGMVSRPLAAGGHTLENIQRTGWYTINHIHAEILEQAHQCSARYDASTSELESTGLTLHQDADVNAPFVAESRIRYGVVLHEIIPIDVNSTFIILGHIQSIWMDESLIQEDGYIDLVKAGSLCSSGLDGYHTVNAGRRLPYAKV